MADFQPPPTYSEVILVDEKTGKAAFNPIWLKWFIDLVGNLGPGGAGSVSSVEVAVPSSILSAAGGPITTSGTITLSLVTQAANQVFAGPIIGVAATPAFRVLVAADLPAAERGGKYYAAVHG